MVVKADCSSPHALPNSATFLLQHGNAKYEHSILRAAGGLDWKPLVEEAKAKFTEAGECTGNGGKAAVARRWRGKALSWPGAAPHFPAPSGCPTLASLCFP